MEGAVFGVVAVVARAVRASRSQTLGAVRRLRPRRSRWAMIDLRASALAAPVLGSCG